MTMGVFTSFTLRSLERNRTRTIVTIVGVMLSTALLTGVIATATSVAAALAQRTAQTEGSWQVYDTLTDAQQDTQGTLDALAEDSHVSAAMSAQVAGYASYNVGDADDSILVVLGMPTALRGTEGQARALTVMPTVRAGREPQSAGEVMLPVSFAGVTLGATSNAATQAKSDVPIDLGTTISLPVGAGLSGSVEKGTDPMVGTASGTRTFTVVGFYVPQNYLRNDFSATLDTSAAAIVSTSDVTAPLETRIWLSTSGFTTRESLKDWAASIFGEESYWLHGSLLTFQGLGNEDNSALQSLYGMVAVVGFVVVVAAVSMIGNSFSISVAERTRQFGLLSSLGASRRQLRHAVLLEAAIIGLAGIPLGVACGLAGVAAMLRVSARAFDAMLRGTLSSTAQGIPLVVSPLVVSIIVALSFAVVLISAWTPSWRASRVSAIDAIRQQRDVRLSPRAQRKMWHQIDSGTRAKSPFLERIAGVPGLLASRNLTRTSSRGRTVVMSLALSIILVVLAGTISLYMERAVLLGGSTGAINGADMTVRLTHNQTKGLGTGATLSLADRTQTLTGAVDGLTGGTPIITGTIEASLAPGSISAQGREMLAWYDPNQTSTNADGAYAGMLQAAFVDDATWEALCERAGASSAGAGGGDGISALALNVSLMQGAAGGVKTLAPFDHPSTGTAYALQEVNGDATSLALSSDGATVATYWDSGSATGTSSALKTVPLDKAVTRSASLNVIGSLDSTPDALADVATMMGTSLSLVMPRSALEANPDILLADMVTVPFTLNEGADPYDTSTALTDAADAVAGTTATANVANNVLEREYSKSVLGLFQLLVTIFSVICLLIAIANVFNTLSTSIILRTKEFAVLESVGMGPRDFRRMLVAECASYAARGLAMGLIVSTGVVWAFWMFFTRMAEGLPFVLPWGHVAAACAGVVGVLAVSVAYALRRSHALNIVEALRAEAI